MKSTGTVYLVGAGPGDAGLLTLRGAELLRRADVVVYDLLVNPELLGLAGKDCELISRGKRQEVSQDDLNARMIAKAREGKCVVRLKGGDPYIFGRGGEEAEALAAAHIPFEVVPGVSSISAVPNYAGIPLTHRDRTSNFTVFTGHEGGDKSGSALDFDQIARISGTKVILMGVTHLQELTQALLTRGLSPETRVAIVQWGTLPRQKTIEGTLGTIVTLAASQQVTPPALTVIGDVVGLRQKLNWFERRPLFGQRMVVTRAGAGGGTHEPPGRVGRRGAGNTVHQNQSTHPALVHRRRVARIECLRLARVHQPEWRHGVFRILLQGLSRPARHRRRAHRGGWTRHGGPVERVAPASGLDARGSARNENRGRVRQVREPGQLENLPPARGSGESRIAPGARSPGRDRGRHRLLQNRGRNGRRERRRGTLARKRRGLDHLYQCFNGRTFSRALRRAVAAEEVPAGETRLHRTGDQQGDSGIGSGAGRRGESTHRRGVGPGAGKERRAKRLTTGEKCESGLCRSGTVGPVRNLFLCRRRSD